MKTIQLLHISDLHLARRTYFPLRRRQWLIHWLSASPFFHPAAPYLANAAAQAAQILARRVGLDAILVTGDLATTGLRRDLRTALEFIASEPRSPEEWRNEHNRPTLQAAGVPILVMPGNHDRYRYFAGLPGGTAFDEEFADGGYWTKEQGIQTWPVGDDLAIVACDLTLSSTEIWPWNLWGKGRVYPDRLERLVEESRRLRSSAPDRAVLWAVHFPPRFKDVPWYLELMDEHLLVEAAHSACVSHLLCGHTHSFDYYSLNDENKTFVHCAGSALQSVRERPQPSEREEPAGGEGDRAENAIHLVTLEIEAGRIARFDHRRLTYDRVRRLFAVPRLSSS